MTKILKSEEFINEQIVNEMGNKQTFYGVEELAVNNNGLWSEPDVTDGNLVCNYFKLKNYLFDKWKSETKNTDEDEFDEYLQTEDGKDYIMDTFYELAE